MTIPLFFPPHNAGASSSYARRPSDKAREGEVLQLRPSDVVGAFLGDATLARRLYVTDIYLYEERELPMHEFLRVDFYDRCTGMCNCIFVERAAPAQTLAEEADNAFLRTFACFFAGGEAADSFIIPCRRSYTRRPRQLAEKQYRLLQSLHPPPEQPFTLEELSVICDVVSQKYPEYKSLTSQCFWYARSVLGIVASVADAEHHVYSAPEHPSSRRNRLYRGVKAMSQARANHQRAELASDFESAWKTFRRRLDDRSRHDRRPSHKRGVRHPPRRRSLGHTTSSRAK
ncbi:hypothetical protein K525DRAFT_254176, partial [Schizophyllum commune Loenen D]